jgi:hypothetical protein
MTNYSNYLIIILGLLFIGIAKYLVAKKQQKDIAGAYSKKKYLITESEHLLFDCLQQAVGERYYIFPQINLDKILTSKGKNWYADRNRIKQKSVDFVLCQKESVSPILAIELNDSSHSSANRISRDKQVNEFFRTAGLPLLTIPWQSSYDINSLRTQIGNAITKI